MQQKQNIIVESTLVQSLYVLRTNNY